MQFEYIITSDSEPLLRPLPQWGQACENGHIVLMTLYVTPRMLGLVLLQRGLFKSSFFCANVPDRLSSQYHHHLLDRIAVILFCCEMFCFEGTFAYIFTDQSYSSCFQVLKSNLTTAARLIKTKLNRVLPKSPAI